MITEAIIDFFLALTGFIVDKIPDFESPEWMDGISGAVGTVLAAGASMGAWVPTALLAMVFTAVLSSYGIGLGIKVVRIVASFFTAGGGSAA